MSILDPMIRIDLGVTEEEQPCRRHQAAGVQADCKDCAAQPPSLVPVPELEGLWVEIKNPRMLPYGEKKKLFTATLPVLPGDSIDDQLRKRELAEERFERIVKNLITAWNVKAVDDPAGEVLPLPTSDPGALDRAPDIIAAVIDGLARFNRGAGESVLPKAL